MAKKDLLSGTVIPARRLPSLDEAMVGVLRAAVCANAAGASPEAVRQVIKAHFVRPKFKAALIDHQNRLGEALPLPTIGGTLFRPVRS